MFDDAALIFQEIAHSRNQVLGAATQIEIMSSYYCLQTIPPFARRVCPLTQAPSGPTRNETTPAMSFGRPRRSSGAIFDMCTICSGVLPLKNRSVAVGKFLTP
jgi:hypothetical protein